MNPFLPFLDQQRACVIDGGFGSELAHRGHDLSDPLWSAALLLHTPKAIASVHRDYLEAGADVIITASYQASLEGFMARGLNAKEAGELIQSSVFLAKRTRDAFWETCTESKRLKPLVAASIGPYGAYLADGSEYRGGYGVSDETLRHFHRERMRLLVGAGPDILAIETIPSLQEAKVIVEVLQDFPHMGAWVSFSAKDGAHTCSGERIQACAQWLDSKPQVLAIGINCTAPEHISALTQTLKESTTKPIILYPNSGAQYDALSKTWQGPASSHAHLARSWHALGARLIGGCCQTTPKDIAELSAWTRD
ncbi:homocysteine S-methyltransferase [Sulfurospirillum sp. T05]|uniref:Homocysteine S-methyltransferase n=1 Tax=Sulfurospirillum tamanense TaxID=2813362 RepID=A0ABS2WNW2_9BACT|nr:homocysteine S-methyltransferase [Sulfurospirillum tamanensis]MBN2963372.1 homocysteine S-methyltransferase [Sulfurospirillum tamanensis]